MYHMATYGTLDGQLVILTLQVLDSPFSCSYFRYYVQIKAFRGLTPQGDIAIDDISISPECFTEYSKRG